MSNEEPNFTPSETPPFEGAPLEPVPPEAGSTEPITRVAYPGDTTPDDRLMSALAWLCVAILPVPLVSLVLLLAEGNKDRSFQRYHAVASIAFWVAVIVYDILAAIVYLILGIVTLGLGCACLWPIFLLPPLIALYYAYLAYMGRRPTIPVITDIMKHQGWA